MTFDGDALIDRILHSPYHSWTGITLEEVGDGRVVMVLTLAPHHMNPQGIVHGGMVAGLLDSVCGLSLRTKVGMDSQHRTLQLNINYLGAGRTGTVTGIGTAVRVGRRTAYCEGEALNDDGKLIARATATFVRLTTGD